MPLYEYQCEACGRRFELIRKFSDPPLDACPTCGGAVQKLMSSPAFQFKGSGWYITDYAKKGAPTPDGGESKSGEKAKDTTSGASGEKSEKSDKPEKAVKSDASSKTGTSDTASSASSGSPATKTS